MIDSLRLSIPIADRYSTDSVATALGISRHKVNVYWKYKKLSRTDRTKAAIIDALSQLHGDGIVKITQGNLINITGLSRNTISYILKEMNMPDEW